MTVTILESTDNGRIALQERTLTDGSKVYAVLVRGGELPCRNKEMFGDERMSAHFVMLP